MAQTLTSLGSLVIHQKYLMMSLMTVVEVINHPKYISFKPSMKTG